MPEEEDYIEVSIPAHKELYMESQLREVDNCTNVAALQDLCKQLIKLHFGKDEAWSQLMKTHLT